MLTKVSTRCFFIICKEYYYSKLAPSIPVMFLGTESIYFVLCILETSVDETTGAISRKAIPQKFEFVNFKQDKFSFLNVTALVKRVVADSLSCAFSCLDNLACFSFNVAAFPDKAGKFTCEILSSDKYNNSEGFLPSKTFHHFSIVVRNLSLNFALIFG